MYLLKYNTDGYGENCKGKLFLKIIKNKKVIFKSI